MYVFGANICICRRLCIHENIGSSTQVTHAIACVCVFRTCVFMRLHASTCVYMRLHVSTCVNMCLHADTCVHVFVCPVV